jgi:CRISPR-associated protein Csb3
MAEASIPVDLLNPGQVFACLGFLEAADALYGDAEGGFDWSDEADVRFALRAAGDENPFAVVLDFVAEAEIRSDETKNPSDCETFPCPRAEPKALPIRLRSSSGAELGLSHWTDGSSRDKFKLYLGNRSAAKIAADMAKGGDRNRGISALWKEERGNLLERPFDVVTPMGGCFNFDARKGWRRIDVGYSPDDQKHGVLASPVVELLAALGLEHARPSREGDRVRYGVWCGLLAPILARAALGAVRVGVLLREFEFELPKEVRQRYITFAQEVTS